MRSRWAATGAAVVMALGAGGIGLANAAGSSGATSTFTAISPCRLLDSRNSIGALSGKIGVGATETVVAWGENGSCDLPVEPRRSR